MINKVVPKTRPSPFVKRWWIVELTQLRHAYTRLSRAEFVVRNTVAWPEARAE